MATEGRVSRNIKVGRILLWEGRVGRARLAAEFGLPPATASDWLGDFRKDYPGWVQWSPSLRADTATATAYAEAEGRGHIRSPAVLAMLEPYASAGSAEPQELTWDFVQVSAHTFSRVNMAIADKKRLAFTYASMSNPEPHPRLIEPHSILKTGRRWHVRGFCNEKQDFRDFVLGRMARVRILDERSISSAAHDIPWSTNIKVRIVAHPKLSEPQQLVVRQEFFKGTSARVLSCRAALLNYLVHELRAATDVERQAPPDYQLALSNIEECRAWLFP